MTPAQIIITFLAVTVLLLSFYFLIRAFRTPKKIPYQKLFEKKKRHVPLVRNNRLIGWLVLIFFLSIFSFVFLFRVTLISFEIIGTVMLVLLMANAFLLRKKYGVKTYQDITWLSLIIAMGQFSFFLWLNFIPTGSHFEEYRIEKVEKDKSSGITTIELENGVFDEYFVVRTFEGNKALHGDTIIYNFNDGLLGFRIYNDHSTH